MEENKQDAVPDSEINNLQNLENKEIANEDYYKESSENLVSTTNKQDSSNASLYFPGPGMVDSYCS